MDEKEEKLDSDLIEDFLPEEDIPLEDEDDDPLDPEDDDVPVSPLEDEEDL